MADNRTLLIVIIVLLVGILGFMVYERPREPQTIGQAIDEVVEEVGDEIDDHTTAK